MSEALLIEKDLYAALSEQLMRILHDDSLLTPFLNTKPQSKEASKELGKLLGIVSFNLEVGSPLYVFVKGGTLSENWREMVKTRPDSLWNNLLTLRSIFPQEKTWENPYKELEALRMS